MLFGQVTKRCHGFSNFWSQRRHVQGQCTPLRCSWVHVGRQSWQALHRKIFISEGILRCQMRDHSPFGDGPQMRMSSVLASEMGVSIIAFTCTKLMAPELGGWIVIGWSPERTQVAPQTGMFVPLPILHRIPVLRMPWLDQRLRQKYDGL